jgi:hypothetical protein
MPYKPYLTNPSTLTWLQSFRSNQLKHRVAATLFHMFYIGVHMSSLMMYLWLGLSGWSMGRMTDCPKIAEVSFLLLLFLCTKWWAFALYWNPFIILVPVNNHDFLNPKPLLSACRHFTWQDLWTNWSVDWINGMRWPLGSTCGVWINELTSISSWQLCMDTIR